MYSAKLTRSSSVSSPQPDSHKPNDLPNAWIPAKQGQETPVSENTNSNNESSAPSSIRYMPQPDPALFTDPFEIDDFCNNMPEAPKHPRGMIVSHKTEEQPLKIFIWRQITYMDPPQDWAKHSQDLCPFPPELQPFFDFYYSFHVNRDKNFKNLKQWDQGFAPCFLWNKNVGEWAREKIFPCGTNNVKYTITSNYTEFRDADIIYFDYPFYDYIKRAPFWESRRMPPRVSHQKWVLQFGRESTAYYPQVALSSFLQQFDFTMGAPDPLFDVSYPLYPVPEDVILKYANVEPAYPVDKTTTENYVAWVISNCTPKNSRNELMTELIEKIGAHSYGKCQHNKDMPEYKDDSRAWIPWEEVKQQVLVQYPFTLVAENSNCIGYITEKIYDALAVGVIPLYLGAADIADYVPEDSYVDIGKFKTTDELVAYIKSVDRAQFYEWKKEVKADYKKFCRKCHQSKETFECMALDHIHFV
ncbi:Alpha 1,3 fucosyltransferase [Mortierella sp. AD011]|nr:Alpha 1,3 fucosyltransferase [Mortierella sp. AD010]KAF9402395.1 Alpha 1,3 fucosyltransferase [Mortierella sp. AD011]